MKYQKNEMKVFSGLTLVETVLALTMIVIVFTGIVPLFRTIRTNWDSKQAATETLQNGRILIDNLNRNLAKAVRVTDVSGSSETDGYIQFEDNDGNNLRYEVTSNYVQFGLVGDLSDLAGPVSKLQFTCYDACDLDSSLDISTTDVNDIRFVEVQTTLTNSAANGQDKTLTASIYLRTNGNVTPGDTNQITYDYSNRTQGTDIFAYDGEDNQKTPSDSTTPSDVLSSGEYDDIEFDDGTFHTYSASSTNNYAQMRFVIQIEENKNDVTQITATFNGKGVNSDSRNEDGVSFYIWNYTSSDSELLEASADTEAEVTLTGTLTSSLAEYFGGASENTITLHASSNDKKSSGETNVLFADYIELEITATSGGSELVP